MDCVPKTTRSPPEIEPCEVPAVPDGGTIPGSHRFDGKSNHGPRDAGSCVELAKTEGQTPVEEFYGAVYVLQEVHLRIRGYS